MIEPPRLVPHSSFGSSDASPQSSSPSHFQRAGMQRPESLQRNSSTPHVIWAVGVGGDERGEGSHRGLRMAQSCKPNNSLTAVGGLVRTVHAVVVSVAHPDPRYAALGDGTLELGGCTRHLSCGRKRQRESQCGNWDMENRRRDFTHGSPSRPRRLHSCPGRYSGRCLECIGSGGNT